jgi:hypothetical protein
MIVLVRFERTKEILSQKYNSRLLLFFLFVIDLKHNNREEDFDIRNNQINWIITFILIGILRSWTMC